MKAFRNVLVHEYARVDDSRVFEILHTGLGDFEEFGRQVLHTLREDAPGS